MTREEAIKILKEDGCGYCTWQSINPYECENKECKVKEAHLMAIQALSQECVGSTQQNVGNALDMRCDDAISRKDIQDYIAKYLSQYLYEDVRQAVEVIDAYIGDMPTVTQKSGEWILLDECANSGYYCSNCQKKLVKEGWSQTVKKIKYCPNCGAKMVEPQESE